MLCLNKGHRFGAKEQAYQKALVEEAPPPRPAGLSVAEQQQLLGALVLLGLRLKDCPDSPVLPPHLNAYMRCVTAMKPPTCAAPVYTIEGSTVTSSSNDTKLQRTEQQRLHPSKLTKKSKKQQMQ